jgi:endonuclease-3 related protein
MPRRQGPDSSRLREIYRLLRRRFGHAGWWPGEGPFDVCVGAILVQNTSWRNVEAAMSRLKGRGLLTHRALSALPHADLAEAIRPAGTFNVKARRLSALLRLIGVEWGGDVHRMRAESAQELRRKLLSTSGVGPETADSIALYAAAKPVFVVDAYTRRIFSRLGVLRGDESYDEVQRLFESRLPPDADLLGDYHAQIVRLGKESCRARPICEACPLAALCEGGGVGGSRRFARARQPTKRPRTVS